MSKPVDLRPRPLNLTSPVNLPKTFRLQFRHGDEPVVYESVELWIGGGVGEDKGDAITVTAVPAEAPGDWWVTMPALPAQSGESLRLVLNGTVSTAGSLRTSVRAGDADETVAVSVGETTVIVEQVGPPGPPGDTSAAEGLAQQAVEAAEAAESAAESAQQSAESAASVASQARGRWPVFRIDLEDTGDPEIQDAETLDPITKDEYVHGSYWITGTDGGVLHEGGIRLRGRGNSTWAYPKRPWRINFDVETAPLGMTASERNWALLAGWEDPSKIHALTAFTLGAAMGGLVWTPQVRTVELVLNGTPRGIYDLVDLVRMEGARVPGDEPSPDGDGSDGSWLMEISNKERPGGEAPTGDPGFATPVYDQWIFYDTPEAPTPDQEAYIESSVGAFEQALAGGDWGGWQALADPTSFADWWLINETLRNGDSFFWSSCKLTKDPDDGDTIGPIRMGPLWDFDRTFGWIGPTITKTEGWVTRNAAWLTRMWQDASWRLLVQSRWQHLLDTLDALTPDGVDGWIDQQIDAREAALARDDRLWDHSTYTPAEADWRKWWIAGRIAWMHPRITADPNPVPSTVTATV